MKKDTLLLNRLKKFLISLLVFLFPTQLAYHFWPQSAFVFGIRVDYLAPAVYLTDLIIVILLGLWLWQKPKVIPKLFKKYRTPVLLGMVFILCNTFFSVTPVVSIFRWIKLLEIFGLALYLRFEGIKILRGSIYSLLFGSLIFFSLIGIAQFFLGRTIGGLLYFLGERSFSISTPGIALVQIGGREFMRAYSTFSHPNSLAGYFGAVLILLLSVNFLKKSAFHALGFLIIFSGFLLSFSLSALVSFGFVIFFMLAPWKSLSSNFQKLILFGLIVFSLLLPIIGSKTEDKFLNLDSTVSERFDLSVVSGKIVERKFLLGEGLGNFITSIPKEVAFGSRSWLLQPVHNIFLLIFSETGFFGFLILCLLFYRGIKTKLSPVFIFIVLTGILDHYWLTLQQNLLLLGLILGLSI